MLKKYPKIKWTLITILGLLVLLISFGIWFFNLLPIEEMKKDLSASKAENISYLSQNIIPKRGKILAVVTSTKTMGNSGKSTGYELTELSRAYYVFKANGYEVDIASPLGGTPPVVIDDEDMGQFDFALGIKNSSSVFVNPLTFLFSIRGRPLSKVTFTNAAGP
jgi:hypothetical protein